MHIALFFFFGKTLSSCLYPWGFCQFPSALKRDVYNGLVEKNTEAICGLAPTVYCLEYQL
jgi:hypothetical protein